MPLSITVKHGKAEHKLPLTPSESVLEIKVALFSLTGVPPDRQKLMSKAWKGVLKDDASFSDMPELKDGLAFTLMGSAEAAAKPTEKTVRARGGPRGAAPARHLAALLTMPTAPPPTTPAVCGGPAALHRQRRGPQPARGLGQP